MIEFKDWFLSSTEWLYTIIYSNDYFFFDFWSFPHFWSGSFLILLFTAKSIKRKWLHIIIILFTYEIFEIIIKYFVFNIFKPESFKDQLTDFIVGCSGAGLNYLLIKIIKQYSVQSKFINPKNLITTLFTAATSAFLWVGFYDYTINFTSYDYIGFNYITFIYFLVLFWSILLLYVYLINKEQKPVKAISAATFTSIIILAVTEIISHKLFNSNLISIQNSDPLMFLILKGSNGLKFFYVTSALWIIALYEYLRMLHETASTKILSKNF